MIAVPIGMRIKELREAAGWTQSELAARAGVSQSRLSRWESSGDGDRLERYVRAVISVARALGADACWLLTGEVHAQAEAVSSAHRAAAFAQACGYSPEAIAAVTRQPARGVDPGPRRYLELIEAADVHLRVATDRSGER